ncbi:hypothetical protein [Methylovulum psychrotolerans]|uniref:PEP-CTERM protein-sorting domain-containing protein n=1 Tax=Methylovulum psychrotolerans TaxID=1704499 RepID=A0A1Z4BXS8_9GAMM|nr:hypothetical protein [Methylovulum psychrotolerans]ASF46107.1 hypothetical protein CEK71_08445 [Methylovulum psychrotolerans]
MKKINKSIFGCSALAVVAFSLWADGAQAASISTLFNTGVVSGTTLVANGVADSHWTVNSGGTAYGASAGGSGVLSNPPSGTTYWVGSTNPSGQTSSWISSAADHMGVAVANYTYRVTFDLSGYHANSASITGMWASDNQLQSISLNGHTIAGDALTATYATAATQRSVLHAFTLASLSAYFTSGSNYIDFVVNNALLAGQTDPSSNPTGLRVEFTSDASPIDAPETIALLGLGMLALTATRRRKN